MTPAFLGSLYYVSEWAIRLVMLVYVPQRRTAAAARTWLLLIFLLPWPGLAVYLLFGRIRVPQLRREKQVRASQAIRQAEARFLAERSALGTVPPPYDSAATLAFETGDFVPFAGNHVELLDDYAGSIARLIADIDGARGHAHLLFYIFEDDATGRSVADAVSRAAVRGVECRVLIDAAGGERGLARLAPRLRASGVEVHAMLPVGLFRRNAGRFDLRNHRKIAVIDGRIGYTGSQNIVDPGFVAGHPNEELMARVTGPVVAQLEAVFLTDWFLETDQRLDLQELVAGVAVAGTSTAQVLPSGPGYPRENTRDLFIPISQFAQRAYYEDLLAAGVRVHLYRPRFLHAKHLSIDDQVAVLGTTNIDIRSFALNAEVSLLVFDPVVVAGLARVQERYFANSDLLDADEWSRRALIAKVAQNVARLADSLL
jgi:cardiolipin synthase